MSETLKINLLEEERPGLRPDPLSIVLTLAVVVTTVAFWFYGQTLRQRIEERKAAIQSVEAEIKKVEASLPIIEERKRKIAQVQRQLTLIRNLSKDPHRYAALLRELAQTLPPNLWLNSLSIEPSSHSIALQGVVQTTPGRLPLHTVSTLMKTLSNSPSFRSPSLSSTAQGGNSQYSFQLTVQYVDGSPT